jgi:two-component sensor histidine kinase
MVINFARWYLVFFCLLPTLNGISQTDADLQKVETFMNESTLDSADQYIYKIGKTISKESPGVQARYYVLNGKLLKLYSDIGKALENFKKAEVYYLSKHNLDSVLLTKTLKAEVFRYGVLKKESLKEIISAEKYLRKNCAPNIHAYFLNRKLAIYNHWNFKTHKSLIDSLVNEILALENRITDYEIIAYTLNEQGNIIEKEGKIDAAIICYEKALNYAIKHDLQIAGADIALNVARMYQQRLNFTKAIEILHIGISFAKKSDNAFQLGQLYQKMSHNHQFKKDWETAVYYRDTMLLYMGIFNDRENGIELQKIERRYNVELKEKKLRLKNHEISQFQSRYFYILLILGVVFLTALILVINYRRTLRNNKKLDKLYKENEFLLREANHRIHNNLQLIIILINSELDKGSEEMKSQLIKLQSQVDSIATLHKHLYQADDKRMVSMKEYVQEIKTNLIDHFESKKVSVEFDISDFKIATDQAMQIGLIITELSINTLKHAFLEHQENKHVYLSIRTFKNTLQVSYQDNGDKLKGKEIKPKLISQLLRQLKADIKTDYSNGYHLIFTINL